MAKILLSNDKNLILQPIVAKSLGKSPALFLQQLHYWGQNERTGRVIDGIKYVRNSLKGWAEDLRVMSVSTIQRAIRKLKELGILIVRNINYVKEDHTKAYAINYSRLEEFITDQSGQNDQILNKITILNKSLINDQKVSGEEITAENLLRIFNETTGLNVVMTKRRAKLIMGAMKYKFSRSLDKWRRFCVDIASNDWLMGRVNTFFKATIEWLLKFESIQKIMNGEYRMDKKRSVVNEDCEEEIIPEKEELLKEIEKSKEDEEIKQLRKSILALIEAPSYISWFKPCKFIKKDEKFLIKALTDFSLEYITINFNKILKKFNIITN